MNQVKTSSGVPCRYVVMLFWKVSWSTVFVLTVSPLSLVKASVTVL